MTAVDPLPCCKQRVEEQRWWWRSAFNSVRMATNGLMVTDVARRRDEKLKVTAEYKQAKKKNLEVSERQRVELKRKEETMSCVKIE